MKPANNNRRAFLSTSVTAAVATGMATGGFFSSSAEANSSKKLGVAVVGLGSLSTNQIAPALLNTEHCQLTAVVTGTPSKGRDWTAKYGLKSDCVYDYDGFDKIANNDAVDLVYIVLPNSMHHEFTLRAAAAGKHVLCEKPMANTANECREMIAACEKADRKLAVGYRCQFEPNHLKMIEIAKSESFGPVRHIEAGFAFKIGDPTQWRLRKDLAGGGALMDIGIYALQACRYLTGQEPVSITAQETKTDWEKFAEVDESITWRMEFASGAYALCSTSYNYNGLNYATAFGDKCTVKVDPGYSYNGIRLHHDGKTIKLPEVDQFATEMDDFASCILNNRTSKVSGDEGLKDLLAIEAIYRSIEQGHTVQVERA